MEPVRKQAKTGDSESDEEENAARFIIPNPLVFDTVIRSIRCPRLLRICRLVCKSWNDSASSVLRTFENATIKEGVEESILSFRRFIEIRRSNPQLPSPLRKIAIHALRFSRPYFLDLIHSWDSNFSITELSISPGSFVAFHHKPSFLKELQTFLASHGDTLTSLKLDSDDFELDGSYFNFQRIRLPNLKTLDIYFDGSKFPSFFSTFLETVLTCSRLNTLRMCFRDAAPSFLSSCNFVSVQSIELSLYLYHFKDVSPAWSFTRLSLPNVTAVNLRQSRLIMSSERNDKFLEPWDITSLLSHWSGSLQKITVSGSMVDLGGFGKFPNLRSISCAQYTGQFDSEKFPSLKELDIKIVPTKEDIIPHGGVRKLYFDFNDGLIRLVSSRNRNRVCADEEKFKIALEKLGKLFPQVLDFECVCTRGDILPFSAGVITTLLNSFPGLKRLKFNGKFTGFNSGIDSREDPAMSILPYFIELRSLHLGFDAQVTPDIIRYMISTLPKLKYLSFYTYKDFDPEVIRDCLGHLDLIEIHSCNDAETNCCGFKLSNTEKLRILEFLPGKVHFSSVCNVILLGHQNKLEPVRSIYGLGMHGKVNLF